VARNGKSAEVRRGELGGRRNGRDEKLELIGAGTIRWEREEGLLTLAAHDDPDRDGYANEDSYQKLRHVGRAYHFDAERALGFCSLVFGLFKVTQYPVAWWLL
jgi:hypothetical protein